MEQQSGVSLADLDKCIAEYVLSEGEDVAKARDWVENRARAYAEEESYNALNWLRNSWTDDALDAYLDVAVSEECGNDQLKMLADAYSSLMFHADGYIIGNRERWRCDWVEKRVGKIMAFADRLRDVDLGKCDRINLTDYVTDVTLEEVVAELERVKGEFSRVKAEAESAKSAVKQAVAVTEEFARLNTLYVRLVEQGRLDDARSIETDPNAKDRLYEEFGI